METLSENFRSYLQNELVERCKRNKRYSLRAFARSLELEPSSLSKILGGKRRITPQMFEKICEKLNLSPEEKKKYEVTLKSFLKDKSQNNLPAYKTITPDVFKVIADWYHFAILELIHVENFNPNFRWIARALNLTTDQVSEAIERLMRLNLITVDDKGNWHDNSPNVTTGDNQFETSEALKRRQKQVLELAFKAIDEYSQNERDQSAITMAVDSRLLPQAKEKIKNFRRQLCEFLESSQNRDEVFELNISLFPVSKAKKTIQEH